MISCYIGIGSNLGEPLVQAKAAIKALAELPDSTLSACSSLYASRPMGPQDQPDYVNAVAKIDTSLAPLTLLDKLQHIEQTQGRVRKAERWGPRTLDLDILLYGNEHIDLARLQVPHYGLCEREFVLHPLAEIAPDLQLPQQIALSDLLAKVPLNGLERVESIVVSDFLVK